MARPPKTYFRRREAGQRSPAFEPLSLRFVLGKTGVPENRVSTAAAVAPHRQEKADYRYQISPFSFQMVLCPSCLTP